MIRRFTRSLNFVLLVAHDLLKKLTRRKIPGYGVSIDRECASGGGAPPPQAHESQRDDMWFRPGLTTGINCLSTVPVKEVPMKVDDYIVIYRRFINLKNGRVLDALKFGKKAWPIKIRRNRLKRKD